MKKEKKEPKEHKPNWREVYASPEDIKHFLSEHVMLRHNVVRGRTEIHWIEAPPDLSEAVDRNLTEELDTMQPKDEEEGEWLPASLVLQIVGANITQKLSTILLGRAFVALGYRYKLSRGTRKYHVVRRSAEELRLVRQTAGGGDGGGGDGVF